MDEGALLGRQPQGLVVRRAGVEQGARAVVAVVLAVREVDACVVEAAAGAVAVRVVVLEVAVLEVAVLEVAVLVVGVGGVGVLRDDGLLVQAGGAVGGKEVLVGAGGGEG